LWSTAIAEVDLDDPQLGTIWGPFDGKVGAEGIASRGDGAGVRVKITLGRGEGAVSRDLPEDVHWDACIRQPGKSGVPEIMPAKVLETEFGYYFIAMCRVTEDRGGDPPASRSGKQARGWVSCSNVEPARHQFTNFLDQRNDAGTLALGALVDEAAWAGRRLSSPCPGPGLAVDVADANARHFSYSSRSAGSEDHYVAPTLKFAGGALYERSSKRC
jgi:hypothetical protein